MIRSLQVPDAVQQHLNTLTRSLEAACGGNLVSLCVYGSAARGGFVPGISDIDVLVVLRETELAQLTALSDPLLLARDAARVEAIVLKLNDVAPASDVFPLFYEDIRSCHHILSGADPWEGMTTSAAHRRLRIEQELREMKIRMHRAVIDARGDLKTLGGFVSRKVKQARGPLHALLALQGVTCGDGMEEVLSAFGQKSGLDVSPLRDVSRDPAAAHAAFRKLMDAAIQEVDRLEVK